MADSSCFLTRLENPYFCSVAKKKKAPLRVIGRRDLVDIPELELYAVDAKVDTGAYTSALHVAKVKPVHKGGEPHVQFKLLHHSHPGYTKKTITLPIHNQKLIRNSFGIEEMRYIIKAHVVLFGKTYLTEFSLADRSKMDTPVLLGRKLLYRRFLVDVSLIDLSHKETLKQKTNDNPNP